MHGVTSKGCGEDDVGARHPRGELAVEAELNLHLEQEGVGGHQVKARIDVEGRVDHTRLDLDQRGQTWPRDYLHCLVGVLGDT